MHKQDIHITAHSKWKTKQEGSSSPQWVAHTIFLPITINCKQGQEKEKIARAKRVIWSMSIGTRIFIQARSKEKIHSSIFTFGKPKVMLKLWSIVELCHMGVGNWESRYQRHQEWPSKVTFNRNYVVEQLFVWDYEKLEHYLSMGVARICKAKGKLRKIQNVSFVFVFHVVFKRS